MNQIREALRIFLYSLRRRRKGWKKYEGDAKQICEKVIADCWNKNGFFQTSTGHFNQFYVRDFAFCAKSLAELGYEKKVKKTLDYAQNNFFKSRNITTQLTPKGKVSNTFGKIAIDTLPLFIHTFIITKNVSLLNKDFIADQVSKFEEEVVGQDGFVKRNKYYGSMRDHAKQDSSCYANCMLLMLKNDLNHLGIVHNIKLNQKQFMQEFWNGKYFYYDRRKQKRIEGMANTYPFWCGLVKEKDVHKKAMQSIKKAGLDKPFPLKYDRREPKKDISAILRFLIPNYEGNSVWLHLGICYLDVCLKSDLPEYLKSYTKFVQENKNFLELADPKGQPFKSWWYITDEGMLWAAGFLSKIK